MFRLGFVVRFVLVLLFVVSPSFVFVSVAHAEDRSYTIDKVDIDATLEKDGTLRVVEKRTYDFDGRFNGVYERLGDLRGAGPVELSHASVRCMGDESQLGKIDFDEDWRVNPASAPKGHYSYDEGQQAFYVFSTMINIKCDITFEYSIKNMVDFYDDVAELYWMFVGNEWDVENWNITARVHLPAPEGENAVAGENVLLWGHGSDGYISLDSGDVVATVPQAGTSDFAEMRVLFPREWGEPIEGATNVKFGDARQRIIDEEREIFDEEERLAAQAEQREKYKNYALGGAGVASVLGAVLGVFRYKNKHKTEFRDKYWRDVPDRDVHPVLVARIVHRFTGRRILEAALMNLSHIGAIRLEKKGDDYEIVCVKEYKGELTEIDQSVMDFLFTPFGRSEVFASDFSPCPGRRQEKILKAYDALIEKIDEDGQELGIFTKVNGSAVGNLYQILYLVFTMLAVLFGLLMTFMWHYVFLLVMYLIVSALHRGYSYLDNNNISNIRLSPYGREILAKAKALKRWLKDFSKIDEVSMVDADKWGELMVYAAILRVATTVRNQLVGVVPDIDQYRDALYQSVGGANDYENFSRVSSDISRSVSSARGNDDSSGSGSSDSGRSGSGRSGSYGGRGSGGSFSRSGGGGGRGGGGGGAF